MLRTEFTFKSRAASGVFLGALAWVLVNPGAGLAASPRAPIPEGVYFHRFASSVYGPEAVWINPAVLALYDTPTALFMFDYRDPGFGDDRGLALASRSVGYSNRKLSNLSSGQDYSEHIFALAHGGKTGFSTGLSYRLASSGPGIYNNRHFWNFGLIYRDKPSWSLGAVFSNLNRGRINGQRSAMEQLYSLSVRPLLNASLTLSGELAVSTTQNFKQGVFRLGAEGEPIQGLKLYGSWREGDDFELGVRVNFTRSFVGGQSRHDNAADVRSATSYVGFITDRQRSITPAKQRELLVGLSGRIEENPTQPVFGRRRVAFADYILALYHAAVDESIGAVRLVVGPNSLSWGQTQEIKAALENLSGAGKLVRVYLHGPSNRNYYLACSADEILLAPAGFLGLTGLRAEQTFYAGTLEKIGISVDGERIGDYKAATESWMNRGPSQANQEMMNRILDNLYDQFVSEISRARSLTGEQTQELIDRGPYTSAEAKQAGLVDELIYPDQLERKTIPGISGKVGLIDYISEKYIRDEWTARPVIALVVAEGDIGDSPPDGGSLVRGTISPQSMARAFRQVKSERRVKGVTMRINSPGGSALASDLIYRQTVKAREFGPLNVSMSGVAASGGYYISAAADKIFANPATITGSSGIFALKPDLSGLHEKIDLHKRFYSRGKNSGIFSLSGPFSDSERARLKSGLRAFYDRFLQVASGGRGLTPDSVDQLGQGRVWTGSEARGNGLVDSLGGLWQSISATADAAGLKEFEVKRYPKNKTLISFGSNPLLDPFRGLISLVFGTGRGILGGAPRSPATFLDQPPSGYFMRLPFDLSVE